MSEKMERSVELVLTMYFDHCCAICLVIQRILNHPRRGIQRYHNITVLTACCAGVAEHNLLSSVPLRPVVVECH